MEEVRPFPATLCRFSEISETTPPFFRSSRKLASAFNNSGCLPSKPQILMADNRESIQVSSPNNDSETREETHDFQTPPSGKRRKKDIDRTRVSRACDRCKRYVLHIRALKMFCLLEDIFSDSSRKKTRCTGTQPCILCIRSGSACEFTAPYTRGRVRILFPDSFLLI
jgi:Fungal Zn(2)-Cys(6) binuclear cluster domain